MAGQRTVIYDQPMVVQCWDHSAALTPDNAYHGGLPMMEYLLTQHGITNHTLPPLLQTSHQRGMDSVLPSALT